MKAERVLVIPDIHCPHQDDSAIAVVEDFAKDFKPHHTIMLGDLIDADAVSTFSRLTSQVDQLDEYRVANSVLDRLKPTVLLEGNHEERFRRPGALPVELWRLLEPARWFELSKRKVRWVPYSSRKEDLFKIGKMSFVHGFYCNEFAVKNEALAFDCVCHGHTHRMAVFQPKSAHHKHTGFNVGCLCKLDLAYTATCPPRGWVQGFAFGYFFKGGDFSFYPVRLIGKKYAINGRIYQR
jgi:predicted phosphodiesterase